LSDTAEWYLEGLLNYEQANNTHEFSQVEFSRDTLTWPAGNGEISFQDLQGLYTTINDMAADIAIQNGNPAYTFDIIDLQIIETNLKNDERLVEVTISGGTKDLTPTHESFGPEDYWYAAGFQGKCSEFIGQCIGRDATTELKVHFMLPKTIPSYFVSVESVWVYAADYPTNDNPYGNYMMWESPSSEIDCLGPEELNYYLSKFNYIKNDNNPENKTFKTVDVFYDFISGDGSKAITSSEFHSYRLFYGINIGSPIN
jgi:hypothetical protein